MIDLDAYFARIGYTGPRAPTLEVLRGIHAKHPLAIPFENLDPATGKTPALDPASLQQKLIFDGRGGYCFEHNLLLLHVLRALGFEASGLAARVMWNAQADAVAARGHMLVRVDLGGEIQLADVGFGGLTATAPVLLRPDVEQETPDEPFRVRAIDADTQRRLGGEFIMEAKVSGTWKPLHRFDMQPAFQVDYEVSNWYLSTWPQSHFVTGVVAARPAPGKRYALRAGELTTYHSNGQKEQRTLSGLAELRAVLQEIFGIRLPNSKEFDTALARHAPPDRGR